MASKKRKGKTKRELEQELNQMQYQQWGYIPSVKEPISAAAACALVKKRAADQLRKTNKAEITRVINEVVNAGGKVTYQPRTQRHYCRGEHLEYMFENECVKMILKHQAALEKRGYKIEFGESQEAIVGYHEVVVSKTVTEKRFLRKPILKTFDTYENKAIMGKVQVVTVSACCGKEEKDETPV